MSLRAFRLVAALAALLSCAACKDDPATPPPTGLVQDFSLRDVNPNSFTLDKENVSPRRFVGQISAWYFGDAT